MAWCIKKNCFFLHYCIQAERKEVGFFFLSETWRQLFFLDGIRVHFIKEYNFPFSWKHINAIFVFHEGILVKNLKVFFIFPFKVSFVLDKKFDMNKTKKMCGWIGKIYFLGNLYVLSFFRLLWDLFAKSKGNSIPSKKNSKVYLMSTRSSSYSIFHGLLFQQKNRVFFSSR